MPASGGQAGLPAALLCSVSTEIQEYLPAGAGSFGRAQNLRCSLCHETAPETQTAQNGRLLKQVEPRAAYAASSRKSVQFASPGLRSSRGVVRSAGGQGSTSGVVRQSPTWPYGSQAPNFMSRRAWASANGMRSRAGSMPRAPRAHSVSLNAVAPPMREYRE